MQKLEVFGANKLKGQIKISGSKNASLPILAATLLSRKKVYLKNLPRVRDIETMVRLFDPPLLEIHLSSKDLEFSIKDLNRKLIGKRYIVVHAIEQYHDGFILDLASRNKDVRDESQQRIRQLNEHCKKIREVLEPSNKIKIVINCGGFSRKNFLKEKEVEQKELILLDNLMTAKDILSDFELLPQSMPPFPWHQGGRSYHNLLRSTESLLNINKTTGLEICLDFSHTYMECLYSKKDFYLTLIDLIPITSHLHISDSNSSSNEGLNIDEGSIEFDRIFDMLIRNQLSSKKFSLIPEVWQGHHNNGEGFQIALERISRYIGEQVKK